MASSDALKRAKAKYFKKNKDLIRVRTRDYHTKWVVRSRIKKKTWEEISQEFRSILFEEPLGNF